MRDVMGALRTLALAESDITDLTSTRVYVDEIPRAIVEAANTRRPPKMLVLRMGGGFGKADLLPVDDSAVITLSYGETRFEANKVRRAVWNIFVLLDREIHSDGESDVLIHTINPTGGPIPNVEPDLLWPVIAQSYAVKADVLEA